MEEINIVRKNLARKRLLLSQAEYYEKLAKHVRGIAYSENDSFAAGINGLQEEVIRLLNEYQEYMGFFNKGISQYRSDFGTSEVSYEFYSSYTIDGLSLSFVGKRLQEISNRILEIRSLLSEVCNTLGHNYKYAKTDTIFDFKSLDASYSEQDIFYCTRCGDAIYDEVERDGKLPMDEETLMRLRLIKSLKDFVPFCLPFNVVSNLDEQNTINR